MQSLTTIVSPIRDADVAELDAAIDALGNPCRDDLRERLDARMDGEDGTHFMSLHAIAAGDDETAHLVFEYTADGTDEEALRRIVDAAGAELEPIFRRARDWREDLGLYRYLLSKRIGVGSGYFDNPGLCFAGTPGMTVGRIRRERDLAAFVSRKIDSGVPDLRPIDRLAQIRNEVRQSEFAWALDPGPPPLREGKNKTVGQAIIGFAPDFIRSYLLPFAVLWGLAEIVVLATADDLWAAIWRSILVAIGAVLAVLAFAGLVYGRLTSQEKSDWTEERAPAAATLAEIRARENHCAQNHMVSVTVRKPGFVRALTLRLAFWIIGMMASRVYPPGSLSDIATIHAARWITIPGTRKLIFFSNYGGSWESYLEDFITRAHGGLTAVWSNSIGFPRSKNLFQEGATDGERFKRYARHSMQPTRFWYSAYPDLVTDHVRCNAAMRRGLAAALTNDEAKQWLALFGSAPRPDSRLENSQIQSLVFGGLGFMPHGTCLIYDLPEDRQKAREFVSALYEHTAFGDGRKLRHDAILTVAFGARALPKLGLPDECVSGFPAAFLEGMTSPGRPRILGDTGDNAPENWKWGRGQPDLALLVYGRDQRPSDEKRRDPDGKPDLTALNDLLATLTALARDSGMAPAREIPLVPAKKPAIEPFGFVDGVSQPIIRGSYQSFRNNDPIHLVEPGEFVIGYPDDRGNFPPEPELSPLADPKNLLPVAERSRQFGNSIVDAPRALARNGTFLVIRQLEQHVDKFEAYCEEQAERVKDRFPAPYEVTADYIAAKLVGRWRDGSSLVRNPYYPYEKERVKTAERRTERKAAEGFEAEQKVAMQTLRGADAEAGPESSRSETKPTDDASSIPAPAEPSRRADNDFLYGTEDPQALRCPFGAHIRRANPRDSLVPGSMEQVSISNRHRIMRVGRLYKPEKDRDPGLLFMCLNGDIERQFEFVQQTWLVSPSFHGLAGEQDPLTSQPSDKATGYLVPTMDGPVRLQPLPQFVKTLGGGYFFMPSRSLLAFLGGR
jgi:deferrochelatase/peroxidase EfeB